MINELLGERTFLMEEQAASRSAPRVNLEYVAGINHNHGNHTVERKGEILKSTESTFRYSIRGKVVAKPWDRSGDNYSMHIEYKQGEEKGNKIKPNAEEGQKIWLGKDYLESFCNEYLPHMGIKGKLEITVVEPLPGDTPKSVFADMVTKELKQVFGCISKAHKAFVQAYAD